MRLNRGLVRETALLFSLGPVFLAGVGELCCEIRVLYSTLSFNRFLLFLYLPFLPEFSGGIRYIGASAVFECYFVR